MKTVRKNKYETKKMFLNYLNMTTIFRALKRVNSWVCAIDSLTVSAEADRLQHANFSLDKLTVLASIPRIRIKMIILAPVEIT